MKNRLYFPAICMSLMIASCRSEDTMCTDLGVPLGIEFSYVNDENVNLFVGDNPRFSEVNLSMHQLKNGIKLSVSYHFNQDKSKITAMLFPDTEGGFFVQLEPGLVDTIQFTAVENESDPCKSLRINQVSLNKDQVNYDVRLSSWLMVK